MESSTQRYPAMRSPVLRNMHRLGLTASNSPLTFNSSRQRGIFAMHCVRGLIAIVVLFTFTPRAFATDEAKVDSSKLRERGSYLAVIAGCNDCHTPGYAESGGKVPESQWLTGTLLGWSGPWGTTY